MAPRQKHETDADFAVLLNVVVMLNADFAVANNRMPEI